MDLVDQAQRETMHVVQQHFPDRKWGVSCSGGSEMSVSCTIVFGARPGESLASLQAMTTTGFNEIAQAKIDDPNARLAGGTGYGSVIPGELVKDRYLVPLILRCSKPQPRPGQLQLGGSGAPDAEMLALFVKYDCHATTGDQTSGAYVVGGGMVDAIP